MPRTITSLLLQIHPRRKGVNCPAQWLAFGLGVTCVLANSHPSLAQQAASPTSVTPPADASAIDDEEFLIPVDTQTAARIQSFVEKLGSPEFQEREQATLALTNLNAQAFPKLREAYRATSDFEVRSRIERIVRKSFMDYRVYAQFGYLGVSIAPGAITSESNPLIPPGHVGIEISSVQPNTGAERSGLLAADVIVAVNGQPIPGVGANAQSAFTEGIRKAGPGAQVEFHVIRGNSELTLVATLTRAPEPGKEQLPGRIAALPGTIAAAEGSFPAWWIKHFGINDGAPPD